jgi:hypothetical protein
MDGHAILNKESLTGVATAKGKELARILREILQEVEFDRLNRELQHELFGANYDWAPCPMSESRVDYFTIRKGLESCARGLRSPKLTPRQGGSFRFFMFLESLPRDELETLFGEERRDRINDFMDAGLFVQTDDGRIRMNGLFLSSKRLGVEMHGEVIYILADSAQYVNPARVYIGSDSYELLNKLPDLAGLSGTGIDMGSGSGVQLIAALKLFPDVKKMVGYEVDRRAINVSKFNAHLNGVGDRVVIVENDKDLATALSPDGNHADFAISNPPFMPVPEFIEVDTDDAEKLSISYQTRSASDAPYRVSEVSSSVGKSQIRFSLRNMWPVSGWGGPDGMSVLGPMLEILFAFIKPSGKITVCGVFAGNESGPTKIVEFVERHSGWELRWEPWESSPYVIGPSIPAQFMANGVTAHMIRGSNTEAPIRLDLPEVLQPQFRKVAMKYSHRILDIYLSLGVTYFHKGFLTLTKQ